MRGIALHIGQFRIAHGQRVVGPRVEVGELVDPVEDLADQLLQEKARCHPDAAAQPPGHRVGQVGDVSIVDNLERDLNAVYLAVNIVQTVQAALVGVLAGRLFGPLGVAIGIVLNVVVLFTLAEAAPKTWAIQNTERAALASAGPVRLVVGFAPLRLIARALIGLTH